LSSAAFVHAVCVHRACARDRLDDDGIADLLDGGANTLGAFRRFVFRCTNPRRGDFFLHQILVAERQAFLDCHARGAELFAKARCEKNAWLPQTNHTVDMLSARPLRGNSHTFVFVLKTRHTHVSGEMLFRHRWYVVFRLVADADYGGALTC
jgi:hypothetical protein